LNAEVRTLKFEKVRMLNYIRTRLYGGEAGEVASFGEWWVRLGELRLFETSAFDRQPYRSVPCIQPRLR
jgi:hypothetical protein